MSWEQAACQETAGKVRANAYSFASSSTPARAVHSQPGWMPKSGLSGQKNCIIQIGITEKRIRQHSFQTLQQFRERVVLNKDFIQSAENSLASFFFFLSFFLFLLFNLFSFFFPFFFFFHTMSYIAIPWNDSWHSFYILP